MAVALAALVVSLAGSGFAAVKISTDGLADRSIGAPKLADGAVTGRVLAKAAVGSQHIGRGAVERAQLAPRAAGRAQLAPAAVGTRAIAPGAVTAAQIRPRSLTAASFAPGALPPATTALVSAPQGAQEVSVGFGSIARLPLASGSYLVLAKASFTRAAGRGVLVCALRSGAGVDQSMTAVAPSLPATVVLTVGTALAAPGTADLRCSSSHPGSVATFVTITALRLATLGGGVDTGRAAR